jgi:hypothetical protein
MGQEGPVMRLVISSNFTASACGGLSGSDKRVNKLKHGALIGGR